MHLDDSATVDSGMKIDIVDFTETDVNFAEVGCHARHM